MRSDRAFNLQAWVDPRLVAQTILWFESKGIRIKSRSDLINTLIKMTAGDAKLDIEESVEVLDRSGMLPKDQRGLDKLKKATLGRKDEHDDKLKNITKTLLENL